MSENEIEEASTPNPLSALAVYQVALLAQNMKNSDENIKTASVVSAVSVNVCGKLVAKSCTVVYRSQPYFFIKLQDACQPVFVNIAFKAGSKTLSRKLKLTGRYVFTNLRLAADRKTVLLASKDTVCLNLRTTAFNAMTCSQWAQDTDIQLMESLSEPPMFSDHNFTSCTQFTAQVIDASQCHKGIYHLQNGTRKIKLYVTAIPAVDRFSVLKVNNVVRVMNLHDCRREGDILIGHCCLHVGIELVEGSEGMEEIYEWRASAIYRLVEEYDLSARQVEVLCDLGDELSTRFQTDKADHLVRALIRGTKTFALAASRHDIAEKFGKNECSVEETGVQSRSIVTIVETMTSLAEKCRLQGSVINEVSWSARLLDLVGVPVLGKLEHCDGRLCLMDNSGHLPVIVRDFSFNSEDFGAIYYVEDYQYVEEVMGGEVWGYLVFPYSTACKLLHFERVPKDDNVVNVSVVHKESLLNFDSKFIFCFKAFRNDYGKADEKKHVTLTLIFEEKASRYYDVIRVGHAYRISGSVTGTGIPLMLQNRIANADHVIKYNDVAVTQIANARAISPDFRDKSFTTISGSSSFSHHSCITVEGIILSRKAAEKTSLTLTLRDVSTPDSIVCHMTLTNQLAPYSLLPGARVLFRNLTVQKSRDSVVLHCTCASSYELVEPSPSECVARGQLVRLDVWCAPDAYWINLWTDAWTGTVRRRLRVRVVLDLCLYIQCLTCGGKVRQGHCICDRGQPSLLAEATLMADDKTCLGVITCANNCVQKLLALDDESWKEIEEEIMDNEGIFIDKETGLDTLNGLALLIGQLCRSAILCRDWEMVLKPLGRPRLMLTLKGSDLPMRNVRRGENKVRQRQMPYLRFQCVDLRHVMQYS